jgi:polysaccharide export outer membrane protein
MVRFFHCTACMALALLSACCPARQCTPVSGHSISLVSENRGPGVHSGQTLKVTVYGEDDLSGIYTVGPDGALALPLVGAVPVAGQSLEALPEIIAHAYRGGYLKNPKVSVELDPPAQIRIEEAR